MPPKGQPFLTFCSNTKGLINFCGIYTCICISPWLYSFKLYQLIQEENKQNQKNHYPYPKILLKIVQFANGMS